MSVLLKPHAFPFSKLLSSSTQICVACSYKTFTSPLAYPIFHTPCSMFYVEKCFYVLLYRESISTSTSIVLCYVLCMDICVLLIYVIYTISVCARRHHRGHHHRGDTHGRDYFGRYMHYQWRDRNVHGLDRHGSNDDRRHNCGWFALAFADSLSRSRSPRDTPHEKCQRA